MSKQISIGTAAELLGVPIHQARRTADRLWPNLPRIARARVMPRDKLCELAAAIERRYGRRQEAASS